VLICGYKEKQTSEETPMERVMEIRISKKLADAGISWQTFVKHHAFVRVSPELGNCPMMHQVQFCRDDSGRVRSAVFAPENRSPSIITDPETSNEIHLFWIPVGCFQINGIPTKNDEIKSVFVVRKSTAVRVFDTDQAAEALEYWDRDFDPQTDIIVAQTPESGVDKIQSMIAKNHAEEMLLDSYREKWWIFS
jgi:hypothetical protein